MNIRRITHGGWKFIREIGGTGRVSRNNGPRGEKSAIAAKKEEKRGEERKEGKREKSGGKNGGQCGNARWGDGGLSAAAV